MEERSNKTIICSVLFLDIVEYSKKSVTGQISLKDRFNTYLSEAIHDVPVSDRIILDTGDGAAVNFLGDVESALSAALRLRESLLKESAELDPQLLVRIGINLGPVRLVRDINGQPNIVGDGINVAQRVMGFAEPSQILVSRSYYDAVSRLSAEYTGMFHFQGSRTDKHVREHEVYAIGYPGDQTSRSVAAVATPVVPEVIEPVAGEKPASKPLNKTVFYAGGAIVLLVAAGLALIPKKSVEVAPSAVEVMPASSVTVSEVVAAPVKGAKAKPGDKPVTVDKPTPHPKHQPDSAAKPASKDAAPAKSSDAKSSSKTTESPKKPDAAEPVKEGYIAVTCREDAQMFVDGTAKGKLTSGSVTVTTKPGRHKVILTHASFGIFSEEVTVEAGKTERIKPKVCN